MDIRSRDASAPFTTVDGSTIRSLLDRGTAEVRNQSLAEATVEPGGATTRHYHRDAEEIYYVLAGVGSMDVDGVVRSVEAGDAVLIPPGAWHQVTASPGEPLRFLCCCSPPYSDDDTYFS